MDVKLFSTQYGVVLYHYLGLGTTHNTTCHVWEAAVQATNGILSTGTVCIPVKNGYAPCTLRAGIDAGLLAQVGTRPAEDL
ncbi:MAG: hypothetical protein H7Y22_09995 [Gemmatimonadaceae bacterium]|nr:hypothetical protein [Gloeobacterales cyanobacterium ES-bin-141]